MDVNKVLQGMFQNKNNMWKGIAWGQARELQKAHGGHDVANGLNVDREYVVGRSFKSCGPDVACTSTRNKSVTTTLLFEKSFVAVPILRNTSRNNIHISHVYFNAQPRHFHHNLRTHECGIRLYRVLGSGVIAGDQRCFS